MVAREEQQELEEAIPSGLKPRSKRAATLLSQTEQAASKKEPDMER